MFVYLVLYLSYLVNSGYVIIYLNMCSSFKSSICKATMILSDQSGVYRGLTHLFSIASFHLDARTK